MVKKNQRELNNIRSFGFFPFLIGFFLISYKQWSLHGLSWIFHNTRRERGSHSPLGNNRSVIFEFDRLPWIMFPLLAGYARLFFDTERKTEQWLAAECFDDRRRSRDEQGKTYRRASSWRTCIHFHCERNREERRFTCDFVSFGARGCGRFVRSINSNFVRFSFCSSLS